MMVLCRNIIEQNKECHNDFEYYITILEKIENNYSKNPDISIESSKALIEGICKTIVLRLDITQTEASVKKLDFKEVYKKACVNIQKHSEIEDDFINRTSAMVHRLAELRNNRGDISHGKSIPKVEVSSIESARLIMHVTDALVNYLLDTFFKIDLSYKEAILYEDNPDFNYELDELYPTLGISYSRALFDQDVISYEEQLKEYLDRQNEQGA
jgi:hypothetical protein